MENNQERIRNYLSDLAERAREAFAKGNKLGAAYLAMIAGMWANYLKCSRKINPYAGGNDDIYLWRWWEAGYDAYDQAIGLTYEIRKQIADAEKQRIKKEKKDETKKKVYVPKHEIPTAPGEKKKSFWNMKLW